MERKNRIGFGGKPVGQVSQTRPDGIKPNPSKMEPKGRSQIQPNTSKMEPKNRPQIQPNPSKMEPKNRIGFGGKPVGEGVHGRQPKMQTPCNFFQGSNDTISFLRFSPICHYQFK